MYGGAVDLAVALLGEDVGVLDGRQLAGRLGDVERTIRKLEAVAVSIVAEADRREVFRDDGHVSVRGWVKASLRVADLAVTHRVRTATLVRDLPMCADALAAGRLGVDQIRELARLHANRRCGDQLAASVDGLIEVATTHTFDVFKQTARQWEQLADADGAHRDHDHAHAARTARAVAVGDEVFLEGRFGTAQGAAITEVLERFTQAEFDAEWDDLRARLGDDACPHLLERSDRQRRADAVAAIFAAAATALPDAKRAEPVVRIIIDQAVYDAQLAAMTGHSNVADVDLTDLAHQRCQTTSGLPIDPADAVAASLIGHIRRVIIDADGLIIDLGRRSRIFTGSAREAARLQAAFDLHGRCLWPGCGHHHCQIDHTQPWPDGGPTDVRNAGPLCPRHNRFKTRGYRTWRDPHGIWHTQRPDGTEIQAA